MLLSRQNKLQLKLPKRFIFLSKLFFLTALIHVAIALMLFCVSMTQEVLMVHKQVPSDAHIVFLPLIKKATQAAAIVSVPAKASVLAHNKQSTVSDKALTVTCPKKTTIIAPQLKKQEKKQVLPKKVEQKVEQKTKKVSEKKNVQEAKKEIAQKLPPVAKSDAKKQQKNSVNECSKHLPVVNNTTAQDNAALTRGIIYMGSVDKENMELVGQLKESIEKAWRRPAGLGPKITYEAIIFISQQGQVVIESEKKSRALVLDAAARLFVLNHRFPKSVWGRQIEIVL